MILHRILDWLRPERIVATHVFDEHFVALGYEDHQRWSFNEQDERIYIWARRWRWTR